MNVARGRFLSPGNAGICLDTRTLALYKSNIKLFNVWALSSGRLGV